MLYLIFYKSVPYLRSLAKYAAAFFYISRSSRSTLFSHLNLVSSLSSLRGGLPGLFGKAFSPFLTS